MHTYTAQDAAFLFNRGVSAVQRWIKFFGEFLPDTEGASYHKLTAADMSVLERIGRMYDANKHGPEIIRALRTEATQRPTTEREREQQGTILELRDQVYQYRLEIRNLRRERYQLKQQL